MISKIKYSINPAHDNRSSEVNKKLLRSIADMKYKPKTSFLSLK